MKKMIIASSILASLTLPQAFASVMATRIVDVGDIEEGEKDVMVLAQEEGRVLWISAKDTDLINALKEARDNDLVVNFDFSFLTGKINGVQLLEDDSVDDHEGAEKLEDKNAREGFSGTLMSSIDASQSLFNKLDGRTKRRSQCYNRAHGWSYDMWSQSRVNSMKVFIFFTQRYIRAVKYKWWFHVAPYVITQTEEGAIETVMDRTFTRGPTPMRKWTDQFMETKAFCPEVTKYSDYRNNQNTQDCYLIKTSMYYKSPRDIELLETTGRSLTNWDLRGVAASRKEAFRNWRDYNP